MMAEMIATYSAPGASPGVAAPTRNAESSGAAPDASPGSNASGYLNEVRSQRDA